MKKIRLLWNFMKGNRSLYVMSILSVGLATVFSLIIPLISRFTIDSIIGDKPFEVPGFLDSIINTIGGKNVLVQNIWICSSALILITAAGGIFLFLKGKWSAQASESIAKNIRNKLFTHLQLLPFSYHAKVKTGDIIQRCTSDVDTIRRFLAFQLVEVGRAIFMVTLVLFFMIPMSVKMTLVSMIIVPFIFAFAVVFFLKIKKAFKRSDESEGRLSTVLQENLTGVRVVRAFAKQRYEMGKFEAHNKEFRDLTYRLIRLLAWYWATSDFFCLTQICTILVVGSYWAAAGSITLGTLLAFVTYTGMLLWPVRQLGRVLTDMGKALVSIERIQEILDTPEEKYIGSNKKTDFNGEIEFKNVCFEYEKNIPVLKNISFKVKSGETVAILGPTGSGKTTLVQLLPRLYDHSQGSISIGGQDISRVNKKILRKNIGIVLQEPFLFSKTLKENIGIAEQKFGDDDIFSAAESANIHDAIIDFEDGYETAVGERGVTLSGGQKQRIAIARTIIRNSPILIFDDSLSAVDTKTDAIIRRELNRRNKNTTTFIISHRLTTLAEADMILVIDKGKLVQQGTHEKLINESGLYKRIWAIQNEIEAEIDTEIFSESESASLRLDR